MSIQSDVRLIREFLSEPVGQVTDAGIERLSALLRLEARLLYPGITSESEREAARAEAYSNMRRIASGESTYAEIARESTASQVVRIIREVTGLDEDTERIIAGTGNDERAEFEREEAAYDFDRRNEVW